jgi:O-methyltransferase
MTMSHQGVVGWKQRCMAWFDALFFRVPFMTELLNQGVSKNLGLLSAWHFVSRIHLEGDYLEFGVFRGETFRNSMRAARQAFRSTLEGRYSGRFFAFDSFEGLPDVPSMNSTDNIYSQGEFSASRTTFEANIRAQRSDFEIIVTPGWFSEVLTSQLRDSLALRRAAFVNIDCDLYESTVPILEFIVPILQTGTVVYFDDWFSIKGSMQEGEARACHEWLERHLDIKLVEYRNVGITGKMFIVNRERK